jgi:hypothetical protein
MKEDINVEAECKNCNHPVSLHTPKCHIKYREFDKDRLWKAYQFPKFHR